ncbi:MAG TPA: hypothetical protein VEK79_24365 [Thermoanaerobaculia bacterium]|nr:hypothetical protein [Thermoanaerobaculia bacterium]
MAFSFHANTLAFGGQRGDVTGARTYLPSRASVTLPPEGGFGESVAENFKEGDVSFYRAESRVYGNSFQNTLFKTHAQVTVYDLDIAGIIQADVLTASVTSINMREKDCTTESKISFDANIVGLVIDGMPYDIELDLGPFAQYGTFSEFTDSFTRMNEEQVNAKANAYNWPPDECKTRTLQGEMLFHVPARCNNGLRATVLKDIRPALPGMKMPLRRQGFTLEIPRYGLVHLGEVMLTTGRRGINVLRVELGKTLDLEVTEPQPDALAGEPRPFALALAPDALGSTDGGYTVVHLTGNGTDFGPP